MFGLFHRILLCLDPELAHAVGVRALRLLQFVIFRVFQLKGPPLTDRPPFIHLPGNTQLSVGNRLGLAAGFDKNAEVFAALSSMGFGFVETGTVTVLPQSGNPTPRLWRVAEPAGVSGAGLINQMGFNNCGLEQFKKNLQRYRSHVGIPILANIGKGKETPNENALDDYSQLIKGLEAVVDGFVINLSSPNTPNLRNLQTVEFIEELNGIAGTKPTLIKLAPDLSDLELKVLVDAIHQSANLTGVVLTNTSKSLAVSLYQRTEGGYSGPALLARSLECVSIARQILGDQKLVIGVGGVTSVASAKRMREAGADLVEIYTGFVYQGPALVSALKNALSQ